MRPTRIEGSRAGGDGQLPAASAGAAEENSRVLPLVRYRLGFRRHVVNTLVVFSLGVERDPWVQIAEACLAFWPPVSLWRFFCRASGGFTQESDKRPAASLTRCVAVCGIFD